jgi:hypothetical protein
MVRDGSAEAYGEVQRGVFATLIYTGAKILKQKLSFTLLEGIQGKHRSSFHS